MSLKDGIVVSREIKLAFFETVEAVKRGEEGSLERLSKYVDSGMIRQEQYDELTEKYHIARAKREAENTKQKGNKKSTNSIAEYYEKKRKSEERKDLFCSGAAVVILLFSMLCTMAFLIEHEPNGESLAFWYLLLFFWALDYISKSSSK